MAERTAAALIHEFSALGAKGEVVRPFGVGQWAGGGRAAVLALDAGGAEPNACQIDQSKGALEDFR